MSGVFVVVPVMISAPVVFSAATAVAAALGYSVAQRGLQDAADSLKLRGQESSTVEQEIEDSQGLAQLVDQEGELVLTRPDVVVRFTRSRGDRCRMTICGLKKQSPEELQAIGQELTEKMLQQYAYHQIVSQMKQRGFSKIEETVEEDGTIRLTLRRWD
ncbi:MAG TPA: DUF1257 domain-containing protein [Candidatus Nitrosotenuis sp.]|jgi:hypothetical protein|nr:DUF1257 domain-containing protein [Candidatus Nitrosotenuis sp.]